MSRQPIDNESYEQHLRGSLEKLDQTNYFDTEAEFRRFIESIDFDLRRKGIPITARQLEGMRSVAVKLGTDIYAVPSSMARQGDYSNLSLSAHVSDWFESEYGERLNVKWIAGATVVLIGGDFYQVRIPSVFGRPQYVFEPEMTDYSSDLKDPRLNVAGLIDGLTQRRAKTVTGFMEFHVLNKVSKGIYLGQLLRHFRRLRYVTESQIDLEAAVAMLFENPPLPGPSNWASLQFAEKIVKAYLIRLGHEPPHTHDLSRLVGLAESQGLHNPGVIRTDEIQCTATSRYDAESVSFKDAVEAHWASQDLALVVLQQMPSDPNSDLARGSDST